MTNTQETVLAQATGTDQLQEEIQFTELVPVEQSRIKDTSDDRDQETTDGLKVIRSFTHEVNEFDGIPKIEKRKIKNGSWKQVEQVNEETDEVTGEIARKLGNRKLRRVRNKDFPKDEVYYFRHEQAEFGSDEENSEDASNDFDEDPEDSEISNKRCRKSLRKRLEKEKHLTDANSEDSKDEEEKDLRLNIDVIIQASYLLEKDNNNSTPDNQNKIQESPNAEPKKTKEAPNSSEISKPNDSEDPKKYNCMMCDAKFKGSGGLRNHYKVVHGTGPLYKCDDCGKEFPLKERLKLHVRTHTGFKPYKCTECGKSFARGGQLSQHRRTHSQVKPYRCDLCMGTFTCAANLALHMKRHTGQKDHTCSICGKGFIRRDALKKHLECLHKDLKSFLCVICNKTFKGHLPQHMRTHAHDRPHACPTCGQKFAQKSQLTVHQRTHTGQRPFRCLVCWQAFAHSTALKLHTRRHTGERPFKCAECNVGFTQLPHWKKHMKCIHKRSKPYSCRNCNNFFKKKNDLEAHEKACHNGELSDESSKTDNELSKDQGKFKTMSLERMRLLLAVLLKRISKPERLDELGFGKRLIDEILQDSLVSAGKVPVKIGELNEHETLRKNLETFLEWTVPKEHWVTFKKMNKSPEEILETLTTS